MSSPRVYTNTFKLPGQIVSSILNDDYIPSGHISVTAIISPYRAYQLRKRHAGRIETDISEQMWALLGRIGHRILERSDDTGAIHEESLRIEVDGWILTGHSDCYVTHDYGYKVRDGAFQKEIVEIPPTIRDYKFTSLYALKYPKPEWEAQVNAYAHMWRAHGYPVERGEIVAVYRDWKKMDSIRKSSYPPPVQTRQVPLWPDERVAAYILERVRGHRRAESLPDDDLPYCTPGEQWRREVTYAVKKPGRKSALRVFKSRELAALYVQSTGAGTWIEERPAEPVRCNYFCEVSSFCDQYLREKESR